MKWKQIGHNCRKPIVLHSPQSIQCAMSMMLLKQFDSFNRLPKGHVYGNRVIYIMRDLQFEEAFLSSVILLTDE